MHRILNLTTCAALLTLTACTTAGGQVGGGTAPSTGASGSGVRISSTAVTTAAPTLTPPGDTPTHLASTANRNRAAGVLHAEATHYRKELAAGLALLGTRGYSAWSATALVDAKPELDATNQADVCFTTSDQPPALDDWSTIDLSGDLATFAADGNGVGAPGKDALARTRVKTDQQQMESDLRRADNDADLVAAGK